MARLNGVTIEHLADLAADTLKLQEQIKALEAEVEKNKAEVKTLMQKHRLAEAEAGPYKWVLAETTRRSIPVDLAEKVLDEATFTELVQTSTSMSLRVKANA